MLCSCSWNLDKSKLTTVDYRLFQGTQAEKLSVAVMKGDTLSIREEVQNRNIPVDIKSERGTTLLMMATYNSNLKSVRCLLNLGADPNLHEDTIKAQGANSVVIASEFARITDDVLRLLLAYGGDPNSHCKGENYLSPGNYTPWRKSALEYASMESLDKVKILLNAGADINRLSDDEYKSNAIMSALLLGKMDILLYLLENGADYTIKYPNLCVSSDGVICDSCDILSLLRLEIYPLDSREYKQKMDVVNFLKERGMDYAKAPIPNWIADKIRKNHPNDWQDYLEKY